MSIFGSIGKAVKGAGKAIGGVVNNTVGKIPIVGGAATHIGNALSGKEPFLQGILKGGVPIAAGLGTFGLGPAAGLMSKLGAVVGGGQGSTLAGTIGKAVSGGLTNPGGGLNLGKVIGAGGAIANTVGGISQRKANQKALQSQTDLRNQLLSRILSGQGQTYNFSPEY